MNLDRFSLFLKLIAEAYPLKTEQIYMISNRLMADEVEFERVWYHFQNRYVSDGVDDFKPFLEDLLL